MMMLIKIIFGAITILMLYLVFPTEDVKITTVTKSYYNLATNTKSFLSSKNITFIDEYNQNTANNGDEFMFPLTGTDEYGKTSAVIRHGVGYTASYGGYHNGSDMGEIVKAMGDTGNNVGVLSATKGKVTSAGYNTGGMGNYVKVQGDDGVLFTYMHMNELPLVRTGDPVQPGTLLGYMGNTGDSSGKHLHFQCEIPANNGDDRIIYNPYTMTKVSRAESGDTYGGSKVKFYFDDKLEKIKIPSSENNVTAHPSYPVLGIDDIVPNPNTAYVPEVIEFDKNYWE